MTQADWAKACEERFSWWVRIGETAMRQERRIIGGLTRSAIVNEVDRVFPTPDFAVHTHLDRVTNKMRVEVKTAPPYATRDELELAGLYLRFLITCEAVEEDLNEPIPKAPEPSVRALLRKRLQN